MFTYKCKSGEIRIDFEHGSVCSLHRGDVCLTGTASLPLFSLRFREKSGAHEEADAFAAKLKQARSSLNSAYAVYQLPQADIELSVEFDEELTGRWRMNVLNRCQAAVEWVDLPQIPLPAGQNGVKTKFYWPYNEGVEIDDLDAREKHGWAMTEPEFPGHGSYALFPGMVESQFVAADIGGSGLYLGAEDTARGIKNIDIVRLDGAARLKMRVFTGCGFGADYRMDFDIVTRLFTGGWQGAAEIYRSWFVRNLPEGLTRVGENRGLPEWYADSPVVVTYPVRGIHDMDRMEPNRLFPYENALPRIDELAQKLNCRILVLLMHWEGTAPWAPPFVWPPFGGEAMLRSFIDKLHAKGHLLGVYLSGIGFTEQSNLIADYHPDTAPYRDSFTLSPDQKLLHSRICTGQRRGYDLCPACEKTAEIVAGQVRSMQAAGIDYAQILDQNHGGNPYYCYAQTHGHAPVPGRWMTESMKNVLSRAHEEGKNMLFGCESAAGEPYLPYLLFSDCRFELGWFNGRPIPMFSYVYHEYLHNFMGNQVCAAGIFAPHPESMAYRLAYSFTSGDLPTLILTDDGRITQAWGDRQFDDLPDEAHTLKLVRSMMTLRRGEAAKYLCGGRMIAPLPAEDVQTRFFARADGREDIPAPAVLTSRWQAQDGSQAQVLVNWTREDAECRVNGQLIRVPAGEAMLIP